MDDLPDASEYVKQNKATLFKAPAADRAALRMEASADPGRRSVGGRPPIWPRTAETERRLRLIRMCPTVRRTHNLVQEFQRDIFFLPDFFAMRGVFWKSVISLLGRAISTRSDIRCFTI
jgi:hypothetical protein